MMGLQIRGSWSISLWTYAVKVASTTSEQFAWESTNYQSVFVKSAPLHLLRNVTLLTVTMKTVTTRIPEDDEEALSELEQEMTADRSEVLRRLIRKGLTDWRKEKALDQLREHKVTLRRAAEIADVTYVEMLSLAAEEGIDTGYTTDELERDLGRL